MTSVALMASAIVPVAAQSLPSGPSVAAGAVSIATPSGTSVIIDQSSRNAVINWNSFSIGKGNSVAINNGGGATLNRVTGNIPSRIDGSLTATGSVYLVNPAGVAVGPTGKVLTGGSFTASTLDVSDAAFLKGGDKTFSGTSKATVTNAGSIGSLGGDVALIAREVGNSGTITAPNGTVGLAAGYEVLVKDGAVEGGKFHVKVGGADTAAATSGRITAAAAEIRANGGNVYALAGNTGGVIAATGTASVGGRVFLTAGDSGTVEAGGSITATRTAENGAVQGGDIRVSGGKTTVSGALSAKGAVGKGGTAGKGGTVAVTGAAVTLTGTASLDASGGRGGAVVVGGDYQGGKDAARKTLKETVANAKTTTVAAGARLSADGTAGDGGSVVVWSDERTDFAGTIAARGAGTGGNGGSAEVSGKALLSFTGTADLRAASGKTGTLLLDPYNLTISAAADGNVSGLSANGDDSVLSVATLTAALASANVTVTTGSGGSQAGTITVAAPVAWSADTVLTLAADGDIVVNAPITATGSAAGLVLQYGAGKGYSFGSAGSVTLSGANATLRIGETGALQSYTLIHDMAALDDIETTGPSGLYALAQSLDAAGTTYTAAVVAGTFTGTFTGLGNSIANLTINAPDTDDVGLFGTLGSGSSLRDIGLVNATVIGKSRVGGLAGATLGTVAQAYVAGGSVTGSEWVGGLIGANDHGVIGQSYATGNVTGSGSYVGGLVGGSSNATYETVHATGAVVGSESVGGLIGDSDSDSITKAFATGSVSGASTVGGLIGALRGGAGSLSESYATGDVTATVNKAGGLLGGAEDASVSKVYATGSVTGTISDDDGEHFIGGLVGDSFYASISDAYATGRVTLSAACTSSNCKAGGLAGRQANGTIRDSYWDKGTTGQAGDIGDGSGSNTVGIETDDAFSAASYASFNFANAWYMVEGQTRPFLRSEQSTTIFNAHQLQLMQLDLSAAYTLAADIDAGETGGSNASGMWRIGGSRHGFLPVGDGSAAFTGSLDGQGHVIRGLTIAPADYSANHGLFGVVGAAGSIRDLGLLDVSITGNGITVGGLVGENNGTITNAHVTGSVQGLSVGGLVGRNTGTIAQSYSTASVEAPALGGDEIGGLVSENTGTITQSYATGNVTGRSTVGGFVAKNSGAISQSYATGAVTATIGTDTGGFAGLNSGSISQSYATGGAVSGNMSVGGLVGMNSGSIDQSYTTKAVSGSSLVGGFAGYYVGGTITSSYFDTTTSGTTEHAGSQSTLVGVTGLTTALFQDTASFMAGATGWDFDTVWAPPSGGYYPVLYSLVPVTWVKAVSATSVYGSSSGTISAVGAHSVPGAYVFGKAGDSLSLVGGTITVDATTGVSATPTITSLTTANVMVTSAKGAAYRVFYYGDVAQTVTPAALTITADAASKTYGDTATLTGFTTSGLKNSDGVTGVTLTSAGTAATAGVGGYAITAASATGTGLSNYTITYADGTLTVDPAALSITADAASKTYGDTATLTGYTTSGLKNSDGVTSVSLSSAGTVAAAGVGGYAITAASATGTGLSNYTITYAGGTLTVDPAALTITADAASKTYGDTATLTGFTTSGLKNDDGVTGVTLTSAGTAATAGVGSYAITAASATGTGLLNYTITYAGGTLTVDPAALTITADAASKTYGDTATLTGYTTSGLKNNDGVTSVSLSSAGTAATAGVGGYAITAASATGTGLSNYTITYADGTLTVDPAALTITADAASKTYGDTTALTGYTTSGLKNSDGVTGVTLTSAGTAATAGVGSYAITAASATGTGLSNYTITYAGGTLTVDPAALTITADAASKTYGDTATLTGFTTSGLKNDDGVTGVTLTSAGTAATAGVGGYAITASSAQGSGLSNYTITYAGGTLTVDPAALTITADAASKTYGDTATLTGFTTSGLKNSDGVTGVTLTSAGTAATAGVGGYVITAASATGTSLSNYTVSYVGGTLTVDPAALTITADAASKTYGDTATLTGFTTSGLKNDDGVTGVTLTSAGTAATAGVGGYAITAASATGTGLSNYTITYAGGTLTVDPAALTITADAASKTYGDTATLTGYTTSGLKNSDGVTSVSLSSAGTVAAAGVGGYAITAASATGTGLSNYTITYAGGTLTVDPAALTITADAASKTYGDTATLTGFTTSGLKNDDGVTGVTLTSAGTAATAGVGGYAITASSAQGSGLSNYTITYAGGTLTVDPAALTITADAASKTYGDTATLTGFTTSGLKNSDGVTSVSLSSAGTAATAGVGGYAITASSAQGNGLSNYTITYAGGTLTVDPAALTITADAASKTYGDTATLTGFTTSGLKNSDDVTGVTLTSAGTAATAGVGGYAITASSAQGNGLSNYTITYAGGTLAVDPAALTITADAASKTYGDTATLTGFTTSGLKNSDGVTGVTLTSAGTAATAGVGGYAITASSAQGNGLSNYTITYAGGTLTVDPAALTITADAASKTYGDTATLTGFTTSGLKNDDGVTGVTLTSAGTAATAGVGGYAITASSAQGNGLSNYTITYAGGTLTVDPAALTITADAASKTYGDTATLTGFTTSGLKNSDGVTSVSLSSAGAAATAGVGGYAITAASATGTGLSNYTVSYVGGTLTVDPAALTVTADAASKTYGDTTALTGFTTSGLKNSDGVTGVTLTSAGTAATAGVGGYAITASSAQGNGLSNYTVSYVGGTLTVDPAALTVTADAASKTYGDTATLTGYTTSGLKNSDGVTSVSLSSAGTAATAGVGGYAITASSAQGNGLSNYTITYAGGTLTVDPAALTITADAASKTYGDTATLTGYTTSGLKNSDGVTGVTLTSAGTAATAGVGGYAITAASATGTGLSNYTITYADGTLTVDPAALTITADAASKTYGDTATLTGYTTNGLKNSDGVTGVTLTSAGTAATAGVGGYAITASSAQGNGLSNYTVSYVGGTLAVTARPIVVTAHSLSRLVGAEDPALTYSVGGRGLVNGDTLLGSLVTAAADSPAGTYAITQGTLAASSNYSLTYNPATLTVTPAVTVEVQPPAPNAGGGAAAPAARTEALAQILPSVVLPRNRVVATASQVAPLSQSREPAMSASSTDSSAADGVAGSTAATGVSGLAAGSPTTQDATGATAACTGGAASSSACTNAPHPENTRVGRFLHFSMR